MTLRALLRVLALYASVLLLACSILHAYVSLRPPATATRVVSTWKNGERVARTVNGGDGVREEVVGEAPILGGVELLFASLVPGRDGVKAELGDRVAYATVDDLLAREAYDRGGTLFDPSLGIGTHRGVVVNVLAEQLGVGAAEVEKNATLSRVRFVRLEEQGRRITVDTLTKSLVIEGVREAAQYLAGTVDAKGRFRYLVAANSNRALGGYSWPRHAGATYFLAQAAAFLDDPDVRYAALRAAARMRDDVMVDCGAFKCLADWDEADLGSSALALVAFVEIDRTGADHSYRFAIAQLASFLRSMQREDGEFKHVFQRSTKTAKDVQLMYYTGEASLALSRAHLVTHDPKDLDASRRALAYLVRHGWSFFGSRYYWAEEHWTCQATDDLWTRAPDVEALRFCLSWHEFQRRLQHEDGDSPFDADGAFGAGPFVSPRLTPAASRGEAAGAALATVRASGQFREAAPLLERELGRSIAFLLRHQFRPGPTHLFADPEAMRGAMPGSPVDWQIRIDYAQHAGSSMLRWLSLQDGGSSR